MDKKFIEQAKNIRREYIKSVNDILSCEDRINQYKSKLSEIQFDMHSKGKEEIREKMMDVEKNIKIIENIMTPHTNKVKSLEKEADILFENIMERYPNYTKEDIQNKLIPHLKEIKF
jgi:ferritin-like metal-binding protein YciE